MNEILIPVIIVAAIGLIAGLGLAIASAVFAVPVDETAEKVRACLPGANCGACGYTGCDGYAKALSEGTCNKPNLCIPGADAVAHELAAELGMEYEDVVERVAMVHCLGDCNKTTARSEYDGIKTCAAASMLHGGFGSCAYGCIGFGDCAAVCPNGAICIENGIAHVDTRKCTGCGLCTKACPHHLIDLMTDVDHVVVTCSNHDMGGKARKLCTNACIGCKKCEKNCPNGAIKVNGNLAEIAYDLCSNCDTCASVCPVGCLMISDNSGIHRFLSREEMQQLKK